MDDQKLKEVTAKIREKYDGEMRLLEAAGVEVIVGPPDRASYLQFQELLMDEKKRGRAFETLLRSCLLYPSAAEMKDALERKPGLAHTFAGKLVEMAGAGADVEEKKL